MLSRYYDVPLSDIINANPGVDPYNLQIGSQVCIPGITAVPPTPPAPAPAPRPTPTPTPTPAPTPRCTGILHTIRAGDTFYMLSRHYDVPLSDIISANPGVDPYNLRIGSQVCIPGITAAPPAPPAPRPTPTPAPTPAPTPTPTPAPTPTPVCNGILHTVVTGDTLYMLAKRYKVTLNEIIQANPGIDCYNLRVGMKLCIPVQTTTLEPTTQDCNGILHTIARGDTLYALSQRYKVSLDAIMNANPNLDPYNLRVGAKLCIPVAPSSSHYGNAVKPASPYRTYRTQRGDTLTRILERFEITYGALQQMNPQVDFNRQLEDLTLSIPSSETYRTCPVSKAYIVKQGDTLDSISKKLLTIPDHLLMVNPMLATDDFSVAGTKVCIPE